MSTTVAMLGIVAALLIGAGLGALIMGTIVEMSRRYPDVADTDPTKEVDHGPDGPPPWHNARS
jgi:hypothetical protein